MLHRRLHVARQLPTARTEARDGVAHSAGEVLEVRGNRFRLLDAQTGINGAIRIENNIVSLYSPQTGTVTQYSFIRNRSGLILQDATGRTLGFRLRPNNYGSYSF